MDTTVIKLLQRSVSPFRGTFTGPILRSELVYLFMTPSSFLRRCTLPPVYRINACNSPACFSALGQGIVFVYAYTLCCFFSQGFRVKAMQEGTYSLNAKMSNMQTMKVANVVFPIQTNLSIYHCFMSK